MEEGNVPAHDRRRAGPRPPDVGTGDTMSTTVHLEIQVDESRLADVADVLAETL